MSNDNQTTQEQTVIQFQAKYLPALTAFMGKDDIRYYLNGVHIRPHPEGGAVLAATDGKRMLVIRDIEAKCDEEVIFKVAPGLARLCKKPDTVVTIDVESQRLTILSGDEELFLQPGKCLIFAKYVDYTRVLPNFDNLKMSVVDHVNCQFLAEAASIHPDAKSHAFNKAPGVRLWQEDPTKAVIVEYAGHPEYCAIIMPLRADVTDALGTWKKQQFAQYEIPGVEVPA